MTEPADPSRGRRPNRLVKEKSPYLLQHAFNPVDWRPWGEEAFREAKEKDLPIFLSIGYSTCHWCHVMERESFEDETIASYLNGNFVSIKVDREERPDVDAVYMAMVQATTGSGGWPLSLFLTTERRPFYGGTYFPPEDRYGRPGFLSLLKRIREVWADHRDQIESSGEHIARALRREPAAGAAPPLGPATLRTGVDLLKRSYDARHGGFSPAPKFPRAHEISFLLRRIRRTGDAEALRMVLHTLDAMADGGIRDHLGGGFHRYATDPRWLVPHFEKMLYDQALIATACLEAFQATGRDRYAQVARETLDYVLRDLRDPQGAFHSAEDADSEGREGRFYVWRPDEIERILGPRRARVVNAFYGVTPEGNFEDGTSILHAASPPAEIAARMEIGVEELERTLAEARGALFEARGRRTRPHLDDKVLTDWNGLMISALASGGAALDEPAYVEAAARAAGFILGALQRGGRLLHRYRDGEAAVPGFLDDYAFFGQGLLDLYQATFDPRWLRESLRLARETARLFRDGEDGALTLSGSDAERLIVPTKEIYDGAIPSGNSVAAAWLLRLGRITGDAGIQEIGEGILRAFAADVSRHPAGYTCFLMALDLSVGPTREIVIAGERDDPETRAMIRAVRRRFLPDAVVVLHEAGERGREIEALAPFVKDQTMVEGKAAAYVCRNHACERPTSDLGRLGGLLDESPGR